MWNIGLITGLIKAADWMIEADASANVTFCLTEKALFSCKVGVLDNLVTNKSPFPALNSYLLDFPTSVTKKKIYKNMGKCFML